MDLILLIRSWDRYSDHDRSPNHEDYEHGHGAIKTLSIFRWTTIMVAVLIKRTVVMVVILIKPQKHGIL